MSKLFRLKGYQIALIVIHVGVAVLLYIWWLQMQKGELGEKPGYGLLQEVEYGYRDLADKTTPVIMRNVEDTGYDVIGLPTFQKEYPRVWIILNKTTPGGKIQLIPNDTKFHVHCAYVAHLPRMGAVDPKVLNYLKGRCEH